MSDEMNRIFAECMDAIESGQMTLGECLAKHPQHQPELEDLLNMATEMKSVPPVRPTPVVLEKVHANLMANIPARAPVEKEQAPAAGLAALFLPFFTWIRDIPQHMNQKWPGLSQPAMGLGLSVVGAVVMLLSVGVMTAVGTSVFSGIQQRSALSRTVSVESTQGVVEVLGTDGEWRPLSKDDSLTSNLRVRTGDDSTAILVFSDGQTASLGPNTEVVLEELRIGAIQGGTITGTVTVTPTKTATATATVTITPTETPVGLVTICHKPGTPAEQTKSIPLAALLGHVVHGDTLGICLGQSPTITPTVTVTPTETMTPTSTVTATETSEAFVTICHKPGTPAEQTMTLPSSALSGHLGHGDTMDECVDATPTPPPAPNATPTSPPTGGGNGETVTVCHKPGTSAQQTMTIPESALNGHTGHGDTLGACN